MNLDKSKYWAKKALNVLMKIAVLFLINVAITMFCTARFIFRIVRFVVILAFKILKWFTIKILKILKFFADHYITHKRKVDHWLDLIVGILMLALLAFIPLGHALATLPIQNTIPRGLLVTLLFLVMFIGLGAGATGYVFFLRGLTRLSKQGLWAKTYILMIMSLFVVEQFAIANPWGVIGTVGIVKTEILLQQPKIEKIVVVQDEALKHEVWAFYQKNYLNYQNAFRAHLSKVEPGVKKGVSKSYPTLKEILIPIDIGIGYKERSLSPSDNNWFGVLNESDDMIEFCQKKLGHKPLKSRVPDNASMSGRRLWYYINYFHGNVLLGLTAYNIGPNDKEFVRILNVYIHKDYEKISFSEVKPYLRIYNVKHQVGPKTYAIEILACAVGYKAYKEYGYCPDYDKNTELIQRLPIPGVS